MTAKNAPLYFCDFCAVSFLKKSDLNRHNLTAKHLKNLRISDNLEKCKKIHEKSATVPDDKMVYDCSYCEYKTYIKRDWNNHLLTKKHQRNISPTNVEIFKCINCNKKYKNYKTYWSHKIKCMGIDLDDVIKEDKGELTKVVSQLLTENKELKNFVLEQSKETMKIVSEQNDKILDVVKSKNLVNTTNNNIINNNQILNINMFLNDNCRDAINLTDFINKLEVKSSDLDNTAQLGFIDGISKIFIDNLKQLNIYQRPIHCTDAKKEIMYIKDQDVWISDNNDEKLRGAIQEVSRKSISKLNDLKIDNPEYQDADSDFSNKCIQIQQQSLATINKDDQYQKVIKNLAKETELNK